MRAKAIKALIHRQPGFGNSSLVGLLRGKLSEMLPRDRKDWYD
jgi:hypothetical protein